MRRMIAGYVFTVTGFLACPCHLVVTLPLAAALLGGTALGGWVAGHQGAIAVGATIYFIGALAGGATLLLAGKGALASTTGQPQHTRGVRAPRRVAADCCTPTGFLTAPAGDSPVERADTAPAGGLGGGGGVEFTRH